MTAKLMNYLTRLSTFVYSLPPSFKKGRHSLLGSLHQYIHVGLLGDYDEANIIVTRQRDRLNQEFAEIEEGIHPMFDVVGDTDTRPLAVLLLTDHDDSLAILGDGAAYVMLMKVRDLSQHFKVIAKVTSMFYLQQTLETLQAEYPNREILHLELVSHGGCGELMTQLVGTDLSLMSEGASVVFDACSISVIENNAAQRLSQINPHVRVFAANRDVIFGEAIVESSLAGPTVTSVHHGKTVDLPQWIQDLPNQSWMPKWVTKNIELEELDFLPSIQFAEMDMYCGGVLIESAMAEAS